MDRNLALEVVRVTEAAALAAARFMGRGDEVQADKAAAEAIERTFRTIAVRGRIAIGECDREDDLALHEEQALGSGAGPELGIAVDAIEGSTACATGGPNALSAIAISDAPGDGFLRCPRTYMNKIAVKSEGRGVVDLDKSPSDNLHALAEVSGVYIEDLTVAILDRPRHQKLIREVRTAGARIKLIPDGDVSSALAAVVPDTGVDLMMGVGGAWQGVIAAAAIVCSGGFFQGRLAPSNEEEAERLRGAGIFDPGRKYGESDLVRGNVMFAATGVTTGDLLRGVRFFKGGATTNSVVMRSKTRTLRFIEAIHRFDFKPEY